MYFAVDKCAPHAVATAMLDKMRARPELNWMALVDGAFDVDGTPFTVDPGFRLYDSDELREVLVATPYILPLTRKGETIREVHEAQVLALARHRNERPMLSFFGTHLPPEEVSERWKQVVNAQTEDGMQFILRFADTRVLESLPAIPDGKLWGAVSGGIEVWYLIDRYGAVVALEMGTSAGIDAGMTQLDDVEFDFLVRAGEPDHVISVLARDHAEFVPNENHGKFYKEISNICKFCSENNVSNFRDVVALCLYVIVYSVKMASDARLQEVIHSGWVKGNLIDALLELAEG